MIAPHTMERDTVIHLPGPEQAFAGHGTAPTLHLPQRADKDPRLKLNSSGLISALYRA